MQVLLVEDDPGVREGLEDLISDYGQVTATSTVPEALALLERDRFHLVISDLRIGSDTLGGRTIVSAAKRRETPVVIISASSKQEIAEALAPAVADEIVEKPFRLEELTLLLERRARQTSP